MMCEVCSGGLGRRSKCSYVLAAAGWLTVDEYIICLSRMKGMYLRMYRVEDAAHVSAYEATRRRGSF